MNETIELYSIISPKYISIEKIIGEIDMEYKELKLGFTPCREKMDLFESILFDGGNDPELRR